MTRQSDCRAPSAPCARGVVLLRALRRHRQSTASRSGGGGRVPLFVTPPSFRSICGESAHATRPPTRAAAAAALTPRRAFTRWRSARRVRRRPWTSASRASSIARSSRCSRRSASSPRRREASPRWRRLGCLGAPWCRSRLGGFGVLLSSESACVSASAATRARRVASRCARTCRLHLRLLGGARARAARSRRASGGRLLELRCPRSRGTRTAVHAAGWAREERAGARGAWVVSGGRRKQRAVSV